MLFILIKELNRLNTVESLVKNLQKKGGRAAMFASNKSKTGFNVRKYAVDPHSFDHTPVSTQENPSPILKKLEDYIIDSDIVRIIQALYPDADSTWAHRYHDDRDMFFYGPIYPQVARESLGYFNKFEGFANSEAHAKQDTTQDDEE